MKIQILTPLKTFEDNILDIYSKIEINNRKIMINKINNKS